MKARARRRWLIAGAILIVLALGIGITLAVFLDPVQMHRRVDAALRDILDCPFHFDHPRIGLGGIAIQGLVLELPQVHGGTSPLVLPEVSLRPKLWSLISGPIVIQELRVTRPDLRIEYDPRTGACNLASIFRKGGGGAVPAIRRLVIEGARVELCGACLPGILGLSDDRIPPPEWLALEVDAEGSIAPGGEIDLRSTIRHPAFSRLALEGTGRLDGSMVRLRANVRKLRIDEDLEQLLPAAVRESFRSIQAIGHADANASIEIEDGRIRQASAQIETLNCAGQIPPLPGLRSAYPFRHLSARALIGVDSIAIEEAKGILGDGPFSARARLRFTESWDAIREATFHIQAERIPLDERMRDSLGEGARGIWDRYSPSGAIGLVVDSRYPAPPGESPVDATVILRGVNMRYRYFPYPADGLRGEIRVSGDKGVIVRPIETERGKSRFAATGEFGLAPASAGLIVIRAWDVPLDATLRAAFRQDHRRIWDMLDPSGIADAVTTVDQPAGEGVPAKVRVDVDLKGVSARYEGFPYRIEGAVGNVRFDDRGAEILGIRGTHGDSTVEIVEGSFTEGSNRVRATSPGLRVDPELRMALPPAFREAIESFGFEGVVRLDATVEGGGGRTGLRYAIDAEILSGRVRHARFPYPVDLAGGTIRVGEEGVSFEKIRSLGETPSIVLERGSAWDADDGTRHYDISMDVEGLPIDDRLREALPEDLRRFIDGVALRGVFSPHVDIRYEYALEDPSRYRVRYIVRASSTGADVDFGIKFHDLVGWTHLSGAAAYDAPHVVRGTARFDRFTFHRARMGPTEISFAYGAPHEALGGAPAADAFVVPKEIGDDLTGERAATSFQVLAEKAELYGGNVRGFLYVDVGPGQSFGGIFDFGGVDFGAAAPDLLRVEDASGRSRGSVLFRGKIGEPKTIEGRGQIRIEEAQLVRLPLILGLFRLLKLDIPKRTYFKDIRVDYRIRDGRFISPHWDSIELKSDALSFRGGGSMDFDLGADLYLSPVFFPGFEIPLLGPLLAKIKQNLVAIQVRGPLDDPQVSYVLVKDIVDFLGGSDAGAR
ncbi:MAG: hypothetical protein JXP34_02275 [Planctomycetes bacterium]|nr:hypothetical protein [Planctomycetota bacterium]